jgi:hypothetical protein
MDEVINYTVDFPESLVAQGKGRNFLVFSKLDMPFTRNDGKIARYELVHRWLSQDCRREDDQVYACVEGSDVTYWQVKELKRGFFARINNENINLFDEFNIF